MNTLKFKDILDSLADGYDPNARELLFDELEQLETNNTSLLGIKLFVEQNGRDYEKIKRTFKSFSEVLENKEKTAKKININWLKYAAILAVVSGLSLYFLFNKKSKSDLTAFEYHETGLTVLMSNNNNVAFSNAMSKYKLGEFKTAFIEFNALPITDTTTYFKGVCQYELGNLQEAMHEFNNVSDTSVFYMENLYFMSLCNIKLNNKEDAINSLKLLTLIDNEMKVKATELLHQLGE